MTDWTKSTGSSGIMMIRDTGTDVEFWIKAGSATFCYDMPWGHTVNGVTNNDHHFRFEAGGAWNMILTRNVTTDQTVTFRLYDTGTSGLGGPTTFSHAITRATVPPTPTAPTFSSLGSTSVNVTFTQSGNGGATIDQYQIGYGTDPTYTQSYATYSGTTTIIGLNPGSTYYFWSRSHNSVGWSNWSARSSVTMLRPPDSPSSIDLYNKEQTSMVGSFTDNGNGGSAIIAHQIGYNTNTSGPSTIISASTTEVINNLDPGTNYYFWARSQNAVGWSNWSPYSWGKTIAGARVMVGGVWKDAVPYVRVGGVWKLAMPWSKSAGYWNKTT